MNARGHVFASFRYPGRVHLVRYEDLSMEPYDVVDELLDFLQLPASGDVDAYVHTHTKRPRAARVYDRDAQKIVAKSNPYGFYRDSAATAFAWRNKMDSNYVQRLQGLCAEPMKRLGYTIFNSKKELDDVDNLSALSLDRRKVWAPKDEKEEGAATGDQP